MHEQICFDGGGGREVGTLKVATIVGHIGVFVAGTYASLAVELGCTCASAEDRAVNPGTGTTVAGE